jgi:hypothetical protein
MTMGKEFKLSADAIKPLATGRGSCIASDHITVQGMPVAFMYREKPELAHDSGWRFFSGLENQAYAENSENFAMYDVNIIANYDPSIIPLLDEKAGTAWGKDSSGEFTEEEYPDVSDE